MSTPRNNTLQWNELALSINKAAERGPTISSRLVLLVNIALNDTRSVLGYGTDPLVLASEPKTLQLLRERSIKSKTERIASYVGSIVNHAIIKAIGIKTISDSYLENSWDIAEGTDQSGGQVSRGTDQDAATLKEGFKAESNKILRQAFNAIKNKTDAEDQQALQKLGHEIADLLIDSFKRDGSQQANDYKREKETYKINHWIEDSVTGPLTTRPTAPDGSPIDNNAINFNFYTSNWKYNSFNPLIALGSLGSSYSVNNKGELSTNSDPPTAQINPAILNGSTKITESWQSISDWGIYPTIDDGGTQSPLTPHWGDIRTFTYNHASDYEKARITRPYLQDGSLNFKFVNEARQIVGLSEQLQSGKKESAQLRATAEFWELGDGTYYPPGYWQDLGIEMSMDTRVHLSAKDVNRLLLATSLTLSDAAAIAWKLKYTYDTVRPFTAINQLFYGSTTPDWEGNELAQTDDRKGWNPYQLRRNFTPPFPDIISGHSAFSGAAAVVLRKSINSNYFPASSDSFQSRFSRKDGFDSDSVNGNELTSLHWETFSERAEEAGFSRMVGGIHMETGNIEGLKLGIIVGHRALARTKLLETGEKLSPKQIQRDLEQATPKLHFGSLGNDALAARASREKQCEIYGFGGDDMLEVLPSHRSTDKTVNLFGGFGDDDFIVNYSRSNAQVRIQDFQSGEKITIINNTTRAFELNDVSVAIGSNQHSAPFAVVSIGNTPLIRLDGNFTRESIFDALSII